MILLKKQFVHGGMEDRSAYYMRLCLQLPTEAEGQAEYITRSLNRYERHYHSHEHTTNNDYRPFHGH
jgi:hypothetical protein